MTVLYAGICAALFVFQRKLIYYPKPRSYGEGVAVMELASGGERIVVSTRPHDGPGALIYFGGNAEDVSYNMPSLASAFPDRAIYLLHYRGYGGSSGSASEEALVADGLALFDRVHGQHRNVVVVGRSLGSGVAVRVASSRAVERLVLVTPYDSLVAAAAAQFPYLPVRWLLRDRFESGRYAPQVSAPTLIIAAERDEVIPHEDARLLRTRFKDGVASFVVIAGATHNSISEFPEYKELLAGL
jgi:pimeloyl-ACP methyl ester carboxylesterase